MFWQIYCVLMCRLTREDFNRRKFNGDLPFGQVPALELEDGSILAQSAAIMRFVGKLSGDLYSNDFVEAAKIDAIIDAEVDLFMGLTVSKYSSRFGFGFLDSNPDIRAEVRKCINEKVLPAHLLNLEKTINEELGPWLAGRAEPSIADFILAPRLKTFGSGSYDGISSNLLDGYPKLTNLVKSFYLLPSVEDFLSKSTK